MVVKMMRWRPWPPLVTKNYHVRLTVKKLTGCHLLRQSCSRLTVEIKWKGRKSSSLASLRRSSVARNYSREAVIECDDGGDGGFVINFDEEFQKFCNLNGYKDNVLHPWEIAFNLFHGLNEKPKKKRIVVGTALLNIAEFANSTDENDFDLNIPIIIAGGSAQDSPLLCISISLMEVRGAQEKTLSVYSSIVPVSSPQAESGDSTITEKEDLSANKTGFWKVKSFTEFVSSRKSQKPCRGEEGSSKSKGSGSGDGNPSYTADSDSLDDLGGDSDEGNDDSSAGNSFGYGTLASANAEGSHSYYSNTRVSCDDGDWVYYSYRKVDAGHSLMEDSTASSSESYLSQSTKRSILPWRKRKLSFRSPKGVKGEPLIKKAYAEDGGDDIDFDRRQLSSDESFSSKFLKTEDDWYTNGCSEFGDDMFVVGRWEQKEITSRDGHMKLETQVFFASIDQRSERAAGESACTVLVAVIADWFQNHHDHMPLKSQFDTLIRDGSLEWRNLCENETYRNRFPDGHFDLETVVEANIRPLSVVPGKSFIGFFHPEGMDEERFEFLRGSMSFDNIWDEISGSEHEWLSNGEPHLFIVSWNDHFFVLKVESDCYYIIDTLGERLYEGCNQAYILKFDGNTVIHKTQNAAPSSSNNKTTSGDRQTVAQVFERNNKPEEQVNNSNEDDSIAEQEDDKVVCRGKEACKEYIKSFLAAIPIRELQADITKNISFSPHQRLQIEFHYTQLLQSCLSTTPAAEAEAEATVAAAETLALAINEIST
ncbi:uncharacterized protein LOC131610907 [Vicia villosa]|uniref:uncharacterized protein LOC131610907 n=1 Tax=Vicia villosa TaxID=3911 RepID=UPI00273CE3F2|nr:uncharacterized protein LOC131610907 [Vicia villosa]